MEHSGNFNEKFPRLISEDYFVTSAPNDDQEVIIDINTNEIIDLSNIINIYEVNCFSKEFN
jgi:hypothetical protein